MTVRILVRVALLAEAAAHARRAAHEVMVVNPAIRNLIRENKLFQIQSVMQAGKSEGMQTMGASIRRLVQRGMITRDQAIAATNNPKLFDDA